MTFYKIRIRTVSYWNEDEGLNDAARYFKEKFDLNFAEEFEELNINKNEFVKIQKKMFLTCFCNLNS